PADPAHVRRSLVVIGASAGGVEALRTLVAGLPPDLDAAICIVLHIDPASPSALYKILRRAGRMPCRAASDGEELTPGAIRVAPPDRHLNVQDGCARLPIGPPAHHLRPAADALLPPPAPGRRRV